MNTTKSEGDRPRQVPPLLVKSPQMSTKIDFRALQHLPLAARGSERDIVHITCEEIFEVRD